MRYPAVFVNHGGGPMPLMGRQPHLVRHMKEIVSKYLPSTPPKAIVVISAHYESNPIRITSGVNPPLNFDYYGFPAEAYQYKYPAPGAPLLAQRIQSMIQEKSGLPCQLDNKSGFDHGVFVPLMVMYPKAEIPVVVVSLHSSLSATKNIALGEALAPLRDEGVLILGSGQSFHNLDAMIRNPTKTTYEASHHFNEWLKTALLDSDDPKGQLRNWKAAPGARVAHPREEHLLPLFVTAATSGTPQLIYNKRAVYGKDHAISGYLFK